MFQQGSARRPSSGRAAPRPQFQLAAKRAVEQGRPWGKCFVSSPPSHPLHSPKTKLEYRTGSRSVCHWAVLKSPGAAEPSGWSSPFQQPSGPGLGGTLLPKAPGSGSSRPGRCRPGSLPDEDTQRLSHDGISGSGLAGRRGRGGRNAAQSIAPLALSVLPIPSGRGRGTVAQGAPG